MFNKFFATQPNKTMVWAHKGGPFWGPENSMKVFRQSKEHKVDAVEADIGMSKDGVPMIMHGSNIGNGGMSLFEGLTDDDHIFRWTREELQT